MRNRIPISVYITSIFVFSFAIAIALDAPFTLSAALFSVSPILIIWMVISVLKSKTFTGTDLNEGEEWGYADKQKDDLGTL